MCDFNPQDLDHWREGPMPKCLRSGKPITIANEFGLFCEDECTRVKEPEVLPEVKELLAKIVAKAS